MTADALTLALERVEFLPFGRVTDDTSILTLRSLVFEPLCRWRDGVVGPGLLASWTVDPEGRDWHFRLRQGARFHDGARCTAEDVVATIGHHTAGLDMFGMPWPYARYLRGAVIEAAGTDLLRISTLAPLADLPEVLAEFFCARAAAGGDALLGTGPYRVEAHEPRVMADLRAVDPARRPARLVLRAIPSPEARHDAVLVGEADAATNLERMARAPRGADGLIWGEAANTLSVMYYLNCRRGLFASAEARLAANLAVDVDAIVNEVFHGLGVPAATIVSPFHLGFREAGVAPIPHDPDRAKALFAKAGGGEVVLRTPLHMPERAPAISAMVARDLERAGLSVRVETEADRPDYARQCGRGEMGDLAIFDSSPNSSFRVLDDKISATTRGQWWQGYEDPALEPLIAAARRCVDDAARARAYGRCLARLRENPPWLYLFHPVELFAARPGVAGLSLDHRGVLSVEG
ncbi:ABC transporter substrate-binding protein [Falsiroseomonas sp. HW251]|uniref:ABC transporter substrate-binding protein n=1 Tax=Falsiroseomonas sp. HW251 TaxID=3390998 RepID=UPI003D30FA59